MGLFDDLDAASIGDDHVIDRRAITKYSIPWCGNKSMDAEYILPRLPYYKGWVDVFGGSGFMTLARAKSDFEVYNDSFSGVTDFYRCMRDPKLHDQVRDKLELYLHSREEWYRCYTTWENVEDIVERATMWYYMNYYSHSAVGRTYGRQKSVKNALSGTHLTKTLHFRTMHERMKNVHIENMDFRTVFKDYAHIETVFYLDPPYMNTDKTNYFKTPFSTGDHKDMLELIFSSPGFMAVSGHPNDLYETYPWSARHEWKHFSVHTEDGQERTEVLWIKER